MDIQEEVDVLIENSIKAIKEREAEKKEIKAFAKSYVGSSKYAQKLKNKPVEVLDDNLLVEQTKPIKTGKQHSILFDIFLFIVKNAALYLVIYGAIIGLAFIFGH